VVPADGLADQLRISPEHETHHYYSVPVPAPSATPGSLTTGLINHPTPGPVGAVRPATPEGTPNPAAPGIADAVGSWPVKSYLTKDQNGVPMIVNVTQPGHPLYPGVVIRYEAASPSGPTIQNEGTGVSGLQKPTWWLLQRSNDFLTDHVWRGQSEDIINESKRPR
jgi:hypothetical protein